MGQTITVLDQELAVCRLDPQAAIPDWATRRPFFSLTRTADELSIVCCAGDVPAGIMHDSVWRALKVEGPFAFTAVGILASIASPLAAAGIGILAIATYDTDYVLVKDEQLERAVQTLRQSGHVVRRV